MKKLRAWITLKLFIAPSDARLNNSQSIWSWLTSKRADDLSTAPPLFLLHYWLLTLCQDDCLLLLLGLLVRFKTLLLAVDVGVARLASRWVQGSTLMLSRNNRERRRKGCFPSPKSIQIGIDLEGRRNNKNQTKHSPKWVWSEKVALWLVLRRVCSND